MLARGMLARPALPAARRARHPVHAPEPRGRADPQRPAGREDARPDHGWARADAARGTLAGARADQPDPAAPHSTAASRRTGASRSAGFSSTTSRRSRTLTAHGQRRGRLDLRRRGAQLADRARRAARGAARRPDARLGPHRGAVRDLRQQDRADERAALHQRARSGEASELTHDALQGDQGAPQGAACRAPPGRHPVHPAGRVRARRAGLVLAGGDRAGRSGTWSSRTSRVRSSRSTARAPSWSPTTPCR